MIKDNQKLFNRLHLLVDAFVIALSYLLAWLIKFETPFADTEPGVTALSQGIFCCTIFSICTRQNGQPAESTKLQALSH